MEVNSTNDVSIEAKYLDSGKMATLVIKEEERLSYNRNPQSSDVIEAMILDAESNIEIDEAIRNFLGLAILHGTLVESSRRGSDGVVYSVDGQQVPLQEEPTHHRVSVYQDALEWLENFGYSASLEELKAKHEAMQTPAVSLSFPEQVGLPKIQLKIRQPRLA